METLNAQTGLRAGTQHDAGALASILSEAFREDPVMNWVFGGPRAIPALFRTLIRHVYLPHGETWRLGHDGAALWKSHDCDPPVPSLPMYGLLARAFVSGGPGVMTRMSAMQTAMAAHRPDAPHLYLFAIGVRDSARGQGLGGRLLDPVLERCDTHGQAAYLENSNPRNHRFYVSRGFETLKVFHAGEGAPPMEAMWRQAN